MKLYKNEQKYLEYPELVCFYGNEYLKQCNRWSTVIYQKFYRGKHPHQLPLLGYVFNCSQ